MSYFIFDQGSPDNVCLHRIKEVDNSEICGRASAGINAAHKTVYKVQKKICFWGIPFWYTQYSAESLPIAENWLKSQGVFKIERRAS